jgi:hypothetical protein
MKNLEYVMSGLGHARLVQKSPTVESDAYKTIVELFKGVQGRNSHVYSCLFNAHTEKNFGPQIQKFYKDAWYKVHSDSGGLQIITQGLDIDGPMKREIYSTQCQYSDIAMSFDEIPVILTGQTSSRNDVHNRLFDDTNFEEFAKRTGKNLKEQLEFFAEHSEGMGSVAKPLMIIQGNCMETYQRWAELILKEIPAELVSGIGGVSLGAAGLGTGPLEDIERMFSLKVLPLPDEIKSTLHILGVGSATRMLPAITFLKNGVLDGTHVSYDSTTHTSGLSMGYIYCDKKQGLKKIKRHDMDWLSVAINKEFGLEVTEEHLWSVFISNDEFFKQWPGQYHERWKAIVGFLLHSVLNFTGVMESLLKDEDFFLRYITKRRLHPYLSLSQVHDIDDFVLWRRELRRHVKSARVRKASDVQQKSNLGDLF